jgi:hypothetical protein
MNIGTQRRTVFIEPVEEPESSPLKEPSPVIAPQPVDPRPEEQPKPTR